MQENTTKTEKIHNKVSCKRDQTRPGQARTGQDWLDEGEGEGKTESLPNMANISHDAYNLSCQKNEMQTGRTKRNDKHLYK